MALFRKPLTHDGQKRTYLLHVPDSYDGSTQVSLIIGFHGGVGTAKNIEEQSGLATFSDHAGFIAVFPDGINRTWNAGGCCGKAVEKDIDDVGFVSALIDHLLDEYEIDPNRVYLTGMSNGGYMSYRLACELSDKIAAIAPVAGSMNVPTCAAASPVSVIHFHSYQDENVPYLGGIGQGISDHYNPPLDSVLTVWAGINTCGVNDSLAYDGDDYDLRIWNSCTDSTEIQLYLTHDGGHSWPMGTSPYRGADEVSTVIDANQLMWDFFQAHAKR